MNAHQRFQLSLGRRVSQPTWHQVLITGTGVLLASALVASAAAGLLGTRFDPQTGLRRVIYRSPGFHGNILRDETAQEVDLRFLARDPHLPQRRFSVRWSGVWRVPRDGRYDVHVGGDDRAALRIDGRLILERGGRTASRTLELRAGLHAIDIEYEQLRGRRSLNVLVAPAGTAPRPFDPASLFPVRPSDVELRRHDRLRALDRSVSVLWICALGAAVLTAAVGLRRARAADDLRGAVFLQQTRGLTTALGAWVRGGHPRVVAGLLVLIVVYAAALRFDALTGRYGPLDRPSWARELELHTRPWIRYVRPKSIVWAHVDAPYRGDPVNYIRFAREMKGFYAAHVREPVFLFTTRMFLRLLHDQDVAVSFASASFSVAAVLVTYLLGAYAFSQWAGLGAALAMAIEQDVIGWSVDGWRDEAFMTLVVLSAYALLRCYRSPSYGNALFLGFVSAAACLTRITSLSFLVPAYAYVMLAPGDRPRGDRARGAAIALLVMAVLIAPYLANCRKAYGDAFYAINYHTLFYRARENRPIDQPIGALSYVGDKLRTQPLRSIHTIVVGMTTFPFLNKWNGFTAWLPGLGTTLALCAIPGLLVFLGSGAGRLLLVVMLTSLVPYALTWSIPGGAEYRFTVHAYPFLLIAASVGAAFVVSWSWRHKDRPIVWPRASGRWLLPRAAAAGGLVIAGWILLMILPYLEARESLIAGVPVTIHAGGDDRIFFRSGWSPPIAAGPLEVRFAEGLSAVVWLPLPRQRDYTLTMRLDPLQAESGLPPTLRVYANGALASEIVPAETPDRDEFEVLLPRHSVTPGVNRITMKSSHATPAADLERRADGVEPGQAVAFRLWYLKISPR